MEYISAKEAAEKWGISKRRVQKLCEEGRIEGVTKVGLVWAIPLTARKPQDKRKRKYKKD
ncbi:DNA-binding protein [Listeria monocytogenes]|uniref:helix-turn-helix domain-containing protein n=1 Tax=Virgibacillus sp. W0181 TaxID=3391581 RepID=UPI0010DD0D0B|nr:DNA-binding protein [Listeria monocytogenes]